MFSISFKGVILGALADIVSTNLLSLPIIFYAMSSVDIAHLPKEQLSAAVSASLHSNGALFALSLFTGGCCSILGGYVAGRLAKRSLILNGALSSFLCLGFDTYAFATGQAANLGPLWIAIALLPISPALGALGGYIVQRTQPTMLATP